MGEVHEIVERQTVVAEAGADGLAVAVPPRIMIPGACRAQALGSASERSPLQSQM